MYVTMHALIVVGKVQFNHATTVAIKQSVNQLSDTATIVLPRNYRLKDTNVLKYINPGDKVTIQLGYNRHLHNEFSGYVREINSCYPIKIHCDDGMYLLKQGNIVDSWEQITLRKLLQVIAPKFKIICPNINLGKFQIDNASPFIVLQELKKQYGFYSWINETTLYCGFAYDLRDTATYTHLYEFGINIPKGGNQLKFQRMEDVKLRIKAISNKPDGSKLIENVGSTEQNVSVRTLNFGDKTKEELRTLATKELAKLRFDGYTGTIKGIGFPRTKAGDSLELKNMPDSDGNGRYLIESVVIKWSKSGFSRENKLSYRI